MVDVLSHIHNIWTSERDDVENVVERIKTAQTVRDHVQQTILGLLSKVGVIDIFISAHMSNLYRFFRLFKYFFISMNHRICFNTYFFYYFISTDIVM